MNEELDQLKQQWQAWPADTSPIKQQEMEQILAGKSTHVFNKLRNALRFEAGLGALLWSFLVYQIIQTDNSAARLALVQIAIIMLPLFAFYYYGWRQTSNTGEVPNNLRVTLQHRLSTWERMLRLYMWGGAVLMPIYLIALNTYFTMALGRPPLFFLRGSTAMICLKSISFLVLSYAVVYILVQFSYGHHLRQLKKCLDEMAEHPEK
jgi:hypothetical protein